MLLGTGLPWTNQLKAFNLLLYIFENDPGAFAHRPVFSSKTYIFEPKKDWRFHHFLRTPGHYWISTFAERIFFRFSFDVHDFLQSCIFTVWMRDLAIGMNGMM